MRYKKTSGNKLLGHCLDFPFITVKGKTPDELIQRIYHDIEVYFNSFPNEANAFLTKNATLVSETVVGVQTPTKQDLPAASREWQEQELICTVPS
jgi:hypothetical protein